MREKDMTMKRTLGFVAVSSLCAMTVIAKGGSTEGTPCAASSECFVHPVGLGLEVTTYASGSDSIQFKWPTHMAFGPGSQEVVSDLKNNRFVFRESPDARFKVSPLSVRGLHSVVYNPADKLYYANDTDNHRIISFADLSSGMIAAETKSIAGVALRRPHDIVVDPSTGWIYAINPSSGHVFRFTAIGENESAISIPLGGYARALTFTNGKLYAIGSAKGRIVEIVDWDAPSFRIFDSFDPTGRKGAAGCWTGTGLVLNDAEFFDGFWYATSYFTKSTAGEADFDEHKFIRFKTLDDLVAGNWTDLSSLVPGGMTPYYLTVKGDELFLAIFNHESPGNGDCILRLRPSKSSSSCGVCDKAAPPNIVVYLIDDLGWNQISAGQGTMGTHSGVYQTPHLEKLANSGVSFTHAYMQPNCAPSRAALLTGQYPARVNNDVYVVGNLNRNKAPGITKEQAKFKGPQQSLGVAVEAITIAEALKQNGYATAHVGKYHVGGHKGDVNLPEKQGFDINIGGYSQGNQPACFARNVKGQWEFSSQQHRRHGRGDFDRFSMPYTQSYVQKHGIAASQVGKPKHVADALADAMEETIGKLYITGKPFYLQLHAYAVHGPVEARPDLKAAALDRLDASQKNKAELAGFVAGMDQTLGRLMEMLDDPNGDGDARDSIRDNTLIIFTSDNGGTHFDNYPLRGIKGMFYEGGIRVPLIASWPGVISPNAVSHHLVHGIDFYPTFLELAGNRWKPSEDEHPLDGESFADILRNPEKERKREPIFYLFPGYMDTRAQPCVVAIDQAGGQRFKLFYYYESDTWELYNLTDDIGEKTNLIRQEPALASELSKKITAWLNQEHPTWNPKAPISKKSGEPVSPPLFKK